MACRWEVHTRRAEARKKIEAKKRNARSALNLSQVLPPVIPDQFQMEPQELSYYFMSAISYIPGRKRAYVSKQTKGDHSSDKENKVHGPVQETRHEWKEEEERVEDANGGDDFSVDEALLVPCGGAFVLVQVLTCQASNNGGEGKLSDAEAEREDVYHKHDGGVVFAALTD